MDASAGVGAADRAVKGDDATSAAFSEDGGYVVGCAR